MILTLNLSRYTTVASADRVFRKFQLLSAATFSVSHGMNDAQKTMGIIAIVLFKSGYLGSSFYIPYWVEFACYLVIALGTMTGGWRIIKTMGTKITKLQPMRGFCAETAAFGCRHSRKHDTYYYGSDYGSRIHETTDCRPLGGGGKYPLGLGFNDTHSRTNFSGHILLFNCFPVSYIEAIC